MAVRIVELTYNKNREQEYWGQKSLRREGSGGILKMGWGGGV